MIASPSNHHLPHRISLFLPLVLFILLSYSITSDAESLKGIGPGQQALNVTLNSCERVQVSGYSRTKIAKYAYSFRVHVAPLITVPERLHNRIQVCVHRNATLGMCKCQKSDWKNLYKGKWTSVMSPYDKQYIDVKFNGESSSGGGSVNISIIEDFQRWRVVCLVAGLVVILAAPVVSSWLPFYYTSSMAVGVFLVILIVIFQIMKLLPAGRKNVMYFAFYGSVVGAGSFILHQFSMMVNVILVNFGLSEDMYNPVAILVLLGIVTAGAAFGFWTVKKFIVSEDGGVDASVAQFVKWSMRSLAATFIFQSTLDIPLAIGAFLTASLSGILFSKIIEKRKNDVVQSHWLSTAVKRRTEFLSRPGVGLWNNGRSVPSSSTVSPSYGLVKHEMISPFSANRRTPVKNQDYYSTYHKTPNRRKMSKEEYQELTMETTREAMAGLTASPGFSDWLIERANRIQLLPPTGNHDDDDDLGSESNSTGEQPWTSFFW